MWMAAEAEELTPEELEDYRRKAYALLEARKYMDTHKREFVDRFDWYAWQLEAMEAPEPQVMILAGNRVGKTRTAAYSIALDLSGDYPDWYTGYRFAHAPNLLVSGVDNQQLKDVVQKELFGEVVDDGQGGKRFSGGWVHPYEVRRVVWSKVTTDLAVSVSVRSKFGESMCKQRAYTQSKTGQGSLSFAGTSLDRIWVDECPPDDLVGQLVTRTMTGNLGRGGRMIYTMTPELGSTKLVTNFMEHREDSQRLVGPVAWVDCPHLTPEMQRTILQGIPEHEQDMRSKGVPYFGSGLVFPIPENRIRFEQAEDGKPITTVPWLRYLRAMDLGIDHPTAIAWLAYDSEIDRIYVLRTYSQRGDAAAVHAAAANSYLDFAPCVFPPDIDTREKGSGKTVREYYSQAGLKNTLDFANPDGSRYVEPGIAELYDRMRSDRFKVFPECTDFFREMRLYHRDNGKLVPLDDDVISAVRYGAMMIGRYGVPYGGHQKGRKPKVRKSFK
jgi:phage terminase large subunit-like protein